MSQPTTQPLPFLYRWSLVCTAWVIKHVRFASHHLLYNRIPGGHLSIRNISICFAFRQKIVPPGTCSNNAPVERNAQDGSLASNALSEVLSPKRKKKKTSLWFVLYLGFLMRIHIFLLKRKSYFGIMYEGFHCTAQGYERVKGFLIGKEERILKRKIYAVGTQLKIFLKV